MVKKTKAEFKHTDILDAQLVIMGVQGQADKVFATRDKDGNSTGIMMNDNALIRLRNYLNAKYPTKDKRPPI